MKSMIFKPYLSLFVITILISHSLWGQKTGLVTSFADLQEDEVLMIEHLASGLYLGSQDAVSNHSSACLFPYSLYNEDVQFGVGYFKPETMECQLYLKSTAGLDAPYYLHATSSNAWTTVVGTYTLGGLTTWILDANTDSSTKIRNSQTTAKYLGSDSETPNSSLYRDKTSNVDWKFYRLSDLQAEKAIELAAADQHAPIDITAIALANAGFELGTPIAWRNDGFQCQNNDQYSGNKEGNYYCEKWVTRNTNLPNAKIYQVLSHLPNGKYEVKLNGGIKIQSATGGDDLSGAGMSAFANYSKVAMDTLIDAYSVVTCVTDSQLTLGILLENVVGNYAYFDNVELLYYGNSLEAYISTLDPMIAEANAVLEAGGYPTALSDDLSNAIVQGEKVKTETSLELVVQAINTLAEAIESVKVSAQTYALFSDYLGDIEEAISIYNRTDLKTYYDSLSLINNDRIWGQEKIQKEILKKDSLFFTVVLEAAVSPEFKIKQRIDVDWVESSFPVEFAQTIVGDYHYVSYYDKDKNFCVAYRKLANKVFKKTILNSKIAWDSHNYIEMIVDDQGYIHISGNMHNVQLNYWRSKNPYDASEFEQLHHMVGAEEDNTTYPHFLKTNSGDLLFHYRYGWSGNGYEVYNIWNPETLKWSRFLDIPLIDGEGQRNAYMNGPYYETDGYYHLYWVWRETPDAATNHTFSYARSKDLKNWESADGVAVVSPIVFAEDQLKVDISTITYGTGTLNNLPKHILDTQNRVVLCNMKYDSLGNSQLYAYRLKADKTWEEKCITNWLYRFQFGGGGSLIFEINLTGMYLLDNGEIGVHYTHSKYGEGVIILDQATLMPIALREIQKSYPVALDVLANTGSYSKPLKSRINQSGNYILHWETMLDNNDLKPSGTLPPDNMLEMIELESDDEPASVSAVQSDDTLALKVVQNDSELCVSGLTIGDSLELIDIMGVVVSHLVVEQTECSIATPKSGVYLLASGSVACKVHIAHP